MEKAKRFLKLTDDESESVSRLVVPCHQAGHSSFYEDFALRGIRVDRVEPGLVACTLKVLPRFIDREGNLANGEIANLVDEVGGAVVHVEGLPMNVSVDMSISFLTTAKLNMGQLQDELEITARVLGQRGRYSATVVLLRNKATGEIIAEGRHSLFRQRASKI
nr:acyl-coenzyme A thioesterase 13-like isoform X1 [Ziziphus jujuba var. spinosa]